MAKTSYIYLTARILEGFNEAELGLVRSQTWKDGDRRCTAFGIRGLSLTRPNEGRNILSWCEEHGDPVIHIGLDEVINRIPHDHFEHSLSIGENDYVKVLKRQKNEMKPSGE